MRGVRMSDQRDERFVWRSIDNYKDRVNNVRHGGLSQRSGDMEKLQIRSDPFQLLDEVSYCNLKKGCLPMWLCCGSGCTGQMK